MHKFIVITDREAAIGFRLAGVDVFEASSSDEARGIITSLSARDDTGILAVSEDLLASLDNKYREKLEKMRKPIVIPLPSMSKGVDKRSYIERLLRKAIGYNIVMRR